MRETTARNARSISGMGKSLGYAWLIARVEHRRLYRQMGGNRLILVVSIVFIGLLYLFLIAGAVGGGYVLGTAVGTDAFTERLSIARAVVAGIVIFGAFMITLMTVQDYSTLDEPTPVLTAIPYEGAVLGRLLANHILFAEMTVVPILATAVAFAVGAGSVASLPVIAVVLLGVLVLTTTVGFVLGQLAALIGARVEFIARYKTLISVLAFVAYFAVLVTGPFGALIESDMTALGANPLGWVADLALVAAPTPLIGIVRPTAAAVTLLAGTTLLTWLAVRLTGVVWYSDPVQPVSDDAADRDTASTASGGLSAGLSEQLFGRRLSRPTLRVAQKSWRRAYRAPLKLQFAAWPVFFLIAPIQQSVEAGEVSTVLAVSIAIYGAWATGAAFTLNPLGDEGAVLPLTLTSGVRGTQLLRGLMFAGVAMGGPLTVVLVTAVGLMSPMGVFSAVVTGVLGGVLCVGACAIGASVGTAFPKFERTRVSRSSRAVVPSRLAFAVYTLVLWIVLLPGLFGSVPLLANLLGDEVGVSTQAVALAGLAGTTLLAGIVGWIGLRSAGKTIDGYTLTR